MKKLDGISATGTQSFSVLAYNGDTVNMAIKYNPATQQWFINVSWENFVLNGTRIFSSPNILNQYDKIIPFGLAVIVDGGGEPFLIDDFSSGRVGLYLLSHDEVSAVNDFYVSIRDAR